MNDFTKDELEKLRDGLNYGASNPYGFTADSIMPLYKKIQSLIDIYDAKVIKAWHCEKCGHVQ